jgi:hypothetical protein
MSGQQNIVKESSRPLKCKLCSRRFKYAVCMKDHIKRDHLTALREKMKQVYIRRLDAALAEQNQKPPVSQTEIIWPDVPVRVSVIRENTSLSLTAE